MLQFDEKQNAIIANGMTQCDKVEFSGKYMLPAGTDRLEIVVNDDCEVLVEDGKAYVVRKKIKHRRFIVEVTIPYGDEYKDAEDLQETIQEIFDYQCDDKGRWKVKVEYINEK